MREVKPLASWSFLQESNWGRLIVSSVMISMASIFFMRKDNAKVVILCGMGIETNEDKLHKKSGECLKGKD